MKLFATILLSFAVLPTQSFADTTSQLNLSASNATQTVQVTDQQMAPVYGTQDYQTTCSQQVLDHYDTECHDVSDTVCTGGGTSCQDVSDTVCNSSGCTPVTRSVCSTDPQTCTPVTRSECDQEPVYVTQTYACTQTETVITGYTLVKTFNHTIAVSVANAGILAAGDLAVTLNISQGNVTAVLSNSYTAALLNYTVAVTNNADSSTVANLTETVVIDVAANGAALTAFAADTNLGLAIGTSAVRISIPGAADLVNVLNFNVRIQKHYLLWFPTDLLNKSFDSSTLGLTTQGADIKADIGLGKLGISNLSNSTQYSVWVTATLKTGNFLNAADFSAAISKSLTNSLDKVKTSF